MQRSRKRYGLSLLALVALATSHVQADEFERPPIEYSKSTPDNCISQLQAQLDRGGAKFEFADKGGYLPALLHALAVVTDDPLPMNVPRLSRAAIGSLADWIWQRVGRPVS